MNVFLAALVAVLVAVVIVLSRAVTRYRKAYHRLRDLADVRGSYGIPRKRVEEFDEAFRAGPFGPGPASEVAFTSRGTTGVPGSTSDFEAWILAVLAKRARVMFEFGTCTGRTTYLWARNSPPDARVATITLPPEAASTYQAESGDDARARQHALEESAFTTFAYSGTDVAHKVEQLYGDSKAFDETPRAGTCDLVFVDGSHAYSYVVSDTRKAVRMVRPGGLVLWHDYGAGDHLIGVHRALNELGTQLPLVHLAGTTLVAYRAPVEGISGAVLRQTASAV